MVSICNNAFLTILRSLSFALALIVIVACGGLHQAWAVSPAATTTLAVTSGAGVVTTVASVVVLTATVNVGSTAVTTGQVNLCDATATYCTDSRNQDSCESGNCSLGKP